MDNKKHITVLLIEDSPVTIQIIQDMLNIAQDVQINLITTTKVSTGIEYLAKEKVDLILLDLSLPESQGLDTFLRVYTQAHHIPIVILTVLDDEMVALKSVEKGAQDYLIKGEIDSKILIRAILYAIERNKTMLELKSMAFLDELTMLYNRRGFLTFAQQELKFAHRKKIEMVLLFMDIDNMKMINDTFGHKEGDLILVEFSTILKRTFRESDIIARLGGDEFVILALDVPGSDVQTVKERLQNTIEIRNIKNRPCELSISTGLSRYDPKFPSTLEELLKTADTLMYQQKQRKKQGHL
ncbi:MAG: GGDEF domain-containing response regulator [Candidatus Desantisbacteria bacterium]